MNILFLASAWRTSLIKAFIETRNSKKLDIYLIAADSDPLSPSLYFADRFHIVPTFNASDFNSSLLDLCDNEKINAIVPLSNKAVVALEKLRTDLKSKGITPVISSSETIRICLDKWESYLFCKKQSIPVPDTVLYNKDNGDIPIEFPLFLKMRKGEGSNNNYLIKTKEQFQALQLDEEYIVQKYIEGKEYTIDILSSFDGKVLSAVPRERLAIRGGEVLKGKTVKNSELINRGVEVAEKLNICGPANIQCIKNDQDNYYFTDINIRFGSGVILSFAAGANFPEMLIKMLRGEKVEKIIGQYEQNLFMLRYDEAIFKKDIL